MFDEAVPPLPEPLLLITRVRGTRITTTTTTRTAITRGDQKLEDDVEPVDTESTVVALLPVVASYAATAYVPEAEVAGISNIALMPPEPSAYVWAI